MDARMGAGGERGGDAECESGDDAGGYAEGGEES
jgi:hypothetical protein